MTTATLQPMAWSNDKIRLTCIENIGLRQLWKLIALDSSSRKKNSKNSSSNNNERVAVDNESLAEFLSKRDILPPSKMSLLKFLAINALELSAPATPVLLQQHEKHTKKPKGWMQLSGHPESIVPTAAGIVRKRVANSTDSEVKAYQKIKADAFASKIVPKYLGVLTTDEDTFIELQDLLYGFKDPNVMDIKMGCRTFLESEVQNKTLRPDLYQKMISVEPTAPTDEEHQQEAITKLRYMLFREDMSSSHSKGFRIEALRHRGANPVNNLKTCRTEEQIQDTISRFLNGNKSTTKELIKRLINIRSLMEKSEFFKNHEIVGSSIFIVYDDERVGIWLIDFAKSRELPEDVKVDHRKQWVPGNREEGLLKGMDELINAFENVSKIQNQK